MMMNNPETGACVAPRHLTSVSVPGEGFRRHAAAVDADGARGIIGDDGRRTISNPDAVSSAALDTIDPVCDVANATNGVDRSSADDFRIAIHEAGHVLIHRIYGNEVSVTIVPDAECSGKTWWPQGVDAAAVWAPDCVSRDDADGVSVVRQGVIAIMAGGAAEMAFLGDQPPKYIGSDIPNAAYFARMVCSTQASVDAFLEHGYQESLALVERHKEVVQALALALVEKKTLNTIEIDTVIETALVRETMRIEIERRARWAKTIANAAEFTAGSKADARVTSAVGGKADVAQSGREVAV